jgi:predicted  nucleic acid-binding Zn-ribbon protein
MTAISREQLETLVELQRIETEKKKVQSVLNQVDEKVNELDKEVLKISLDIADRNRQHAEIKDVYQELEGKVKDNESLIEKIEAKRRAVQTEREYQSLIKEEDQLRTLKAQLEEEMISCMDRMDTIEKELSEKDADLKEVSQRVEDEKDSILKGASENRTQHENLMSKWDDVAKRTKPQLLRMFTQLKDLLPMGDAVVPARNSVCNGCHMNIPAQMYNELQRFDSLKLCPFCNRILYWEND